MAYWADEVPVGPFVTNPRPQLRAGAWVRRLVRLPLERVGPRLDLLKAHHLRLPLRVVQDERAGMPAAISGEGEAFS